MLQTVTLYILSLIYILGSLQSFPKVIKLWPFWDKVGSWANLGTGGWGGAKKRAFPWFSSEASECFSKF